MTNLKFMVGVAVSLMLILVVVFQCGDAFAEESVKDPALLQAEYALQGMQAAQRAMAEEALRKAGSLEAYVKTAEEFRGLQEQMEHIQAQMKDMVKERSQMIIEALEVAGKDKAFAALVEDIKATAAQIRELREKGK
jgi:polyphosphate kinase 2 (PPK2 family)